MGKNINIDGVNLFLSNPDEITNLKWIGGEIYMNQLLAAWFVLDEENDIPMNPQILGKPGVGKTTLAYSAGKKQGLPIFIFQCTVDTRPEDLIISPIISENNTIKYHASSLVTAMIEGGVCILDEANRMSEKSWASLAPLLDQRRYIESIIAGIKIKAHPNFRICVTMNDDSSTFEVPEYIHSRLQPQIFIEFPDRDEELQILEFNLPYTKKDILLYTTNFLQKAHQMNKEYSIRDGINICRYYMKLTSFNSFNDKNKGEVITKTNENLSGLNENEYKINFELFRRAIQQVLGPEAIKIILQKRSFDSDNNNHSNITNLFDKINKNFIDPKDQDKNLDDEFMYDDFINEDFLDELDDDDIMFLDGVNKNQSDRKNDTYYHEKDDDVIHIIEKEEDKNDKINSTDKKSQINKKKKKKIFEENEKLKTKDPNDLIREFLEKKHQNNVKKIDKDDQKNSTDKKSHNKRKEGNKKDI